MNFKYVVFEEIYPVLFLPGIQHCEVAVEKREPTSAGFVSITEEGLVEVFGGSSSLGLRADSKDRKLLITLIGLTKKELDGIKNKEN